MSYKYLYEKDYKEVSRITRKLFNTSEELFDYLVKTGETNFNALHQQDVKNDTANVKNQLMYQMATAWKKHCEEKLKKEIKEQGVNYMA